MGPQSEVEEGREGEERGKVSLGTFGGAEMIGQYKMIKYLKIKTEKECPLPAPSPKPNRCASKL